LAEIKALIEIEANLAILATHPHHLPR